MRRFLFAALLFAPSLAVADEDIAAKLGGYEQEARNLGADLPTPQQLAAQVTTQHNIIDAEVAFSLGDYDTAALALFDLASHPGPDAEAAIYYLAESLYQKGDKGAAHTYFAQIGNGSSSSKYYQPALERLIELAIAQHDDSDVATWLGKLDQIPPGMRRPSSPYVRGKYAYSKGKFDEALAYFQDVPKGSDFEMQALFYTGTVGVAKKDLAHATDVFADLVARKPRTATDRRIMELAALALGRLYYERDQFSKSIDAYLLVDRKSDLFPDMLYEVSWVYVKDKQYDKALRALELLSQSEPLSGRTPTIRILEGNLRIRKAQMIRAAQVDGTGNAADDPGVEYDKANQTFTETHDQFYPAYVAMSQIVDANTDPAQYLAQIAGRSERAFQSNAPLPEAAATMLRDEPGVQSLVGIESDLGEISMDLEETRATIARLEGLVAAHDKHNVYPVLASRRSRIGAIEDDLAKVRSDLADQELSLVNSSGELAQLTANRKQLEQQYRASASPEQMQADHLTQNLAGYDAIEATAGEVDSALDTARSMAVALRMYNADPKSSITADQKGPLTTGIDDAAKESAAIEAELDSVRSELRLGRDLAGVNDDQVAAQRDLRKKLTAAQDAEHKVLAGFASSSHDPGKSQKLVALADRAARVADQLQQTDAAIDNIAEQGLAQVKVTLQQEKGNLAAMDKELAENEAEAHAIGNEMLGAGFKNTKARLYDIVIRTDVGNVDVAWSQKEDNDDDLKRLNLARSRELKQLKDEFRDILEDDTAKPSEPKKKVDLPPPDAGDQRVSPGAPGKTGPTQPSVKPDETKPGDKKTDPKKDPKKGGSR